MYKLICFSPLLLPPVILFSLAPFILGIHICLLLPESSFFLSFWYFLHNLIFLCLLVLIDGFLFQLGPASLMTHQRLCSFLTPTANHPFHTCFQPSFRIVPDVGWCCRDLGCLHVLVQQSVPRSHLRKSLILHRELTGSGSICGGHILTEIQVWCDHASHH